MTSVFWKLHGASLGCKTHQTMDGPEHTVVLTPHLHRRHLAAKSVYWYHLLSICSRNPQTGPSGPNHHIHCLGTYEQLSAVITTQRIGLFSWGGLCLRDWQKNHQAAADDKQPEQSCYAQIAPRSACMLQNGTQWCGVIASRCCSHSDKRSPFLPAGQTAGMKDMLESLPQAHTVKQRSGRRPVHKMPGITSMRSESTFMFTQPGERLFWGNVKSGTWTHAHHHHQGILTARGMPQNGAPAVLGAPPRRWPTALASIE